jgi:hypothetical protein
MRAVLSPLIATLIALTAALPTTASVAQTGGDADHTPSAAQTGQSAGPVATVGAEPYSLHASAVCSAGVCRLDYPRIAMDRRFDIQFVSCFAMGNQSDFGFGIAFLAINDAFATNNDRHVVLWNVRKSFGSTVGEISQPIVLTVSAGQRAEIGFTVDGAATADSQCTLSGELVFLQ